MSRCHAKTLSVNVGERHGPAPVHLIDVLMDVQNGRLGDLFQQRGKIVRHDVQVSNEHKHFSVGVHILDT